MRSPTKRKILRTILSLVPVSLAAAAGAMVYSRYRRELRAAEARVSSGSWLISTPSGPLEYAASGTGAPVLVIHGAGGGFDQALEFAHPLLDNGFRIIAPSRFGYLRTPLQADSSPAAQADAYTWLLDALHVDKVAVIGVSAGAPSAMQFCLRHPERCVAMVLGVPLAYSAGRADAPAKKQPAYREALLNTMLSSDFVFWSMTKLAPGAMFKTILGTPPEDVEEAGADEQARLTAFLTHIEPISRRKKGLQNEAAIAQSLPRFDLERINVPTLVFGVENCLYKTYPGARYTAKNIRGARSYRTGGHLCVGHQTELWSKVSSFLNTAAVAGQKKQIAVST
ncbi:MAG TPA: alpha/beta hydrolase [Candidatus Angelobacter sp.]|nr:alpha/beta hydrolase [Candidatus Angelobacter sp.]